jgi:hypothetical protein
MANNIAGNPWFFDTVMPSAIFDWVWIQEIVWTDYGQADVLVIKDAAGRTILDTKTSAINTENYQKFSVNGRFHGFQLTSLTAGGKVQVFIR